MRFFTLMCVIALLLSAPLAEAVETRWIPAAASNTGLHGSMWTTDLWLYSQVNDQEMVVTATFYTDQMGTPEPVQATITLPPNASVEIPDAVATLFDEHRPGSIRLEADHPFFARSRTSNTGGDTGTYGQGIPAYTQEDTATGYSLLGAANRRRVGRGTSEIRNHGKRTHRQGVLQAVRLINVFQEKRDCVRPQRQRKGQPPAKPGAC